MKPARDVVAAIGRTPLIKLRAASEATACTILGKAEFMNPGGSVKDRAAMAILMFGFRSLSAMPTPASVPPVPTALTKPWTAPPRSS